MTSFWQDSVRSYNLQVSIDDMYLPYVKNPHLHWLR